MWLLLYAFMIYENYLILWVVSSTRWRRRRSGNALATDSVSKIKTCTHLLNVRTIKPKTWKTICTYTYYTYYTSRAIQPFTHKSVQYSIVLLWNSVRSILIPIQSAQMYTRFNGWKMLKKNIEHDEEADFEKSSCDSVHCYTQLTHNMLYHRQTHRNTFTKREREREREEKNVRSCFYNARKYDRVFGGMYGTVCGIATVPQCQCRHREW